MRARSPKPWLLPGSSASVHSSAASATCAALSAATTWSTRRTAPATSSSSSASTRSAMLTSWGRSSLPRERARAIRSSRRRVKSGSTRWGRWPPRRPGGAAAGRQRRGPRHRVGHRLQHRPDDALGGADVEALAGPGPGQLGDPVLVGRVEAGHLPAGARLVGGEPAGRDQPHAEQRGAAEQGDARVHVGLGVRPGQHRQRAAHRQADRAALVGELHRPVAGLLARPEGGGTADRDEAHASQPNARHRHRPRRGARGQPLASYP